MINQYENINKMKTEISLFKHPQKTRNNNATHPWFLVWWNLHIKMIGWL